jgi:hypothetical protein
VEVLLTRNGTEEIEPFADDADDGDDGDDDKR